MKYANAWLRCSTLFAAFLMAVLSVHAESSLGNSNRGLVLELNKISPSENGCLLTFVAQNKSAQDLSDASYEFVLFGKDGLVNQMTVFEFGALPPGKTVVRQFNLGTLDCSTLGRILVNGPSGCSPASTAAYCAASMATASRSSIEFLM